MNPPSLEAELQQYADALQRLEDFPHLADSPTRPKSLSPEPIKAPQEDFAPIVLEVLSHRDRIQKVIEANQINETIPNGNTLHTLSQLDQRLRAQATAIAPFTQTADWRASFNPEPNAWWWFLEAPKKGWCDRLDWLWSAVTVTGLTVSVGLLGDIAPRFLAGGPDSLGAFAVSAQSVLTLLAAGGVLTKAGQEGLGRFLEGIKLPPKYWHEAGAASAIVLLVSFFGFRQSLPWIATYFYTNPGIENRNLGDWGTAEEQLQRAIKLNSDDMQAHFQLGNLYEDLQQREKAIPHYQLAIQGGIPAANNNLARIYILKKDYSPAVSLLLKALDNNQQQPLIPQTKHAILKNLGWARLEQKNYPEAQAKLEEAIALETKTQFKNFEIADSHCLLAKVLDLDKQGDKIEALREWKICNENANITIPEQDEWTRIAQQRMIPKERHK
jgi:tetratricopeptide (TPR) repeat protein